MYTTACNTERIYKEVYMYVHIYIRMYLYISNMQNIQ